MAHHALDTPIHPFVRANPRMPDRYLTISVDDGHPRDLRTAELLCKYGLQATFYVPAKNTERQLMSKAELQAIASQFEIGGHTYNHRPLNRLPQQEMEDEIRRGKISLEQVLGKEVIAFCYPKGKVTPAAAACVRDAGFLGARTCRYFLNEFPRNPYYWGVSTHAANHPVRVQVRHALIEKNFRGLFDFFRVQQASVDWVKQFLLAVRRVEARGGIAHLYLHSWEIDAQDQWSRFERLLQTLAGSNLAPITNGALFELHRAHPKDL